MRKNYLHSIEWVLNTVCMGKRDWLTHLTPIATEDAFLALNNGYILVGSNQDYLLDPIYIVGRIN